MNPLYQMMRNNASAMNGAGNIVQRFMQFRNGFQGNAQQQVQQMLSSGRVTQQQYNQAVQQAQQLADMLKQR